MMNTEALRDAYHDLESALDARASAMAVRAVTARREHLGEVCLTAQLFAADHDARFDFRETAAPGYDALRLVDTGTSLVVECRPAGSPDFTDALGWGCFDTLSKLLIIEGLEVADAGHAV